MPRKRDGDSHRLLLVPSGDPNLSVSDALDFIEWLKGDPREIARELARGHYLRALARIEPRVLVDLQAFAVSPLPPLAARLWARRYGLPSWALPWARASMSLAQGRYWCPPISRREGAFIEDEPTKRSRTPAEIAASAPRKEPRHFEWLALWQLGSSYRDIARRDGLLDRRSGVEGVPIVREACHRLAELIALPLRRARRGRPQARST